MDREETRLDRLERLFEETRQRFEDMGLSSGRMAEGLFGPSLQRALSPFGIETDGSFDGATRRRNGTTMEIDILAPGVRRDRKVLVAIEVKVYLRTKDVDEWLTKLDRFHDFFGDLFRAHDLIGGIAGMKFARGAKDHAERSGLFVFGPSAEVAQVLNTGTFRPKVWPLAKRGRRSE